MVIFNIRVPIFCIYILKILISEVCYWLESGAEISNREVTSDVECYVTDVVFWFYSAFTPFLA
ncbi:hypothetical protein THOM_2985 [Trachipleistophora hominis]|uniref:Uncharacterized protein n=1 Tax=Trachipleistophora hominis TaxID=72359 RepID=L7JRN1_TRAHO|nr:hypothetical protein THOM_2985 [Trachipleistophora hominis]